MTDEHESIPENARNLRAQAAALISQARGQVSDIQHALVAAPAGSAVQSRLSAAAAQTSAAIEVLSQSLSAPGSALRQSDLMALESVVFAGSAAALVAEAATQTTSAASIQSLASTSAATHQEVQTLAQDVFDRKIFDPYLHFTSPEDEAAYRKRENEARRYIEQQLGRGTPEGNLNAGGGMVGQMLDAHAHGAGDSPDFLPRWKTLVDKVEHQHAAMRAAGQSTEEFDRNMATSVRRFLAAKGLSETEIDKRLAASADSLQAVEPFIGNDADSRHLENVTSGKLIGMVAVAPHTDGAGLPRVVASDDPSGSSGSLTIDFDAMNAKLKAAGMEMTGPLEPSGHGLTVTKPALKLGMQLGG